MAGMRTMIAQIVERRARNPEFPVQVQILLLRSGNIKGTNSSGTGDVNFNYKIFCLDSKFRFLNTNLWYRTSGRGNDIAWPEASGNSPTSVMS
jgi:hypothetical protein